MNLLMKSYIIVSTSKEKLLKKVNLILVIVYYLTLVIPMRMPLNNIITYEKYSHGEAVGIGMYQITKLAESLEFDKNRIFQCKLKKSYKNTIYHMNVKI